MKTSLAFGLLALLAACAPAPLPSVDIPAGTGWCCNTEDSGGLCWRCAPPEQATAWCAAFPSDAYYPNGQRGPEETRCFVGMDTCDANRERSMAAEPSQPVSGCVESD